MPAICRINDCMSSYDIWTDLLVLFIFNDYMYSNSKFVNLWHRIFHVYVSVCTVIPILHDSKYKIHPNMHDDPTVILFLGYVFITHAHPADPGS